MKFSLLTLILISGSFFNSELLAQADWKIIGDNGNVKTNTSYYLQVAQNSFHLKYKVRDDPGINLGWGKTATPNLQFLKATPGEIKNGDRVAIYLSDQTGPKKYLKYEKRDHGINLVWSAEPVFEWELRNIDNNTGDPIKTNSVLGIFNTVERKGAGDFLIYCERKLSRTVNLAWQLDCANGRRYPGKLNNTEIRSIVDLAIKHRGKLHPILDVVPID